MSGTYETGGGWKSEVGPGEGDPNFEVGVTKRKSRDWVGLEWDFSVDDESRSLQRRVEKGSD